MQHRARIYSPKALPRSVTSVPSDFTRSLGDNDRDRDEKKTRRVIRPFEQIPSQRHSIGGREGRELERNDEVETVDGREEWNNQAVVC